MAQLATLLTMFCDDEEPDERLKDVYDEILGLNRRIQELVGDNNIKNRVHMNTNTLTNNDKKHTHIVHLYNVNTVTNKNDINKL